MKQVSTLFDALQNEKFAIAVRDDYGVKYYGYEGQGKEWAQWANSVESKSLEESSIPAGIIQGPFKNLNDDEVKSLIVSFGYSEQSINKLISSKNYKHSTSIRIKSESRVPAIMDTPISYFDTSQYSQAIGYKCLSMRHHIKESSFIHEAKVNNYAFNFETWMYVDKPNTVGYKSLRQRADLHVGRSSERRIGMKIKNSLIQTDLRNRVGAASSLSTKSIDSEISYKTIGERIGGGSRAARRAGRMATSYFDPKAWDGDGDGIVQEGTPYERPAIPGINDRATGGNVDIGAARRAWEDFSRAGGKNNKPKSPEEILKNFDRPKPKLERRPNGDLYDPANPQNQRLYTPPASARGISSRITDARTERQITGFASRSGKSNVRKRPGVDKIGENDGKAFEGLDAKQKETVVSNLKKRYEEVQNFFKEQYGSGETDAAGNEISWWSRFVQQTGRRGVSKTDADGNPLTDKSRLSGEALAALRLSVEKTLKDIENDIEVTRKSIASIQPGSNDGYAKKLNNELKKLEREHQQFKQNLEDLITFDEMHKSDDWSLVEHLHPTSRAAGFGKSPGNRKKEGYEDPFGGKKMPAEVDLKTPSSIFSEYETYREGKRSVISKQRGEKIRGFARRVIENAEAKRKKRELRRQRRGTVVGLGGEREGSGKSDIRRRIERAGRRVKRRLQGGTGPEGINKDIRKTKTANPTIFNNGIDSEPKVDKLSIQKLARLFRGKDDPKAEELLVEQKGQNAGNNLGNAWTASGFNATPTQITEDDAEFLIGQGWKPIQRGHGSPPPPSRPGAESYIDDYLNDPQRFITGEGGAAYGPGEYWSHPGRGNSWDSWVAGQSMGVGTLALISPEARVVTISQAEKMRGEHNAIWKEIGKALQGIGGGTQSAKDLDPQELVKEIKNAIKEKLADGDPAWATDAGKIAQQVFQFMSSAGPEDKADVWDAIQHMVSLGNYHPHYTAMAYGYDGVDHEGGSPVVWFNRGALAVIDKPMELDRMRELGEYSKEITRGR